MRSFVVFLVVLVSVSGGCASKPTTRFEFVTGFYTLEGNPPTKWSYAIGYDAVSGKVLFGVILYGRDTLSGERILEKEVPVDGKRVPLPTEDGSLFVIDPGFNLHQAPVTAKEFWKAMAQDNLYQQPVWQELHPFLVKHQWTN